MSRAICPTCHKPRSACICDLAHETASPIEVIIWQHPEEQNHPKNSALLLQLSLTNVRTLVTEQCSEAEFQTWCGDTTKTNVLLSPSSNPRHYFKNTGCELDHLRLIVIDGTWRKARKISHLNPWLQDIPAVEIDADHTPLYRIRKSEAPGQYSTLEAVCLALAQFEGNTVKYQPLLHAFSELNDRWDSFRR